MENYIESAPIAGPRPIGELAEIAVGAYTDIVSITAPSQASYGQTVNVTVKVKNLASYAIYIAVTGRYDGVTIPFSPDYASVGAGATYSFTSLFTMPNNNIKLEVWSWYWTGTEWYQDDYEYVNIALAAVYTGKISRKELEYDSARAAIPASNIPQNKSGLVHIWGRNDMSTTQRMGIYWIAKDPDGITVEEYSTWEALPYTGSGSTHEFIGGRFTLNKVGTYTIQTGLLMNPDAPVYVDTYYGTLCTVAAVVPTPEFAGFRITEYT
jgi:hypothetical protein